MQRTHYNDKRQPGTAPASRSIRLGVVLGGVWALARAALLEIRVDRVTAAIRSSAGREEIFECFPVADRTSWRSRANRVASKQNLGDLDLSETPGHLLRRCQQRSQEIFKEVLGEFGLTQQQTALLLTLARCSTASIQNLSDSTGTDRNTMGDITSRLIRRGLVVRRRAPRDARAYELRITTKGLRMLGRMAPGLAKVQQRILEPLGESERDVFIRMARSIARIDSVEPSS